MPTIASQVVAAAKARVRARFRDRTGIAGASNVQSSGCVEKLKNDLAALLGIDSAHLRGDDKLRDILRVHRNELSFDAQLLMEKVGLKDVVDPFAFDLLHYVEKRIGRDSAFLRRPAFLPQPRNEGEWIERIMGMTVAELSAALSRG
jgi:hypothetical protein